MYFHRLTVRFLAALAIGAAASLLVVPRTAGRDKETVWSYDGGVFMDTDGSLPNGICFRVKGRVSSNHFFDQLKRIDKIDANTVFERRNQPVADFPDKLLLEFILYDTPCGIKIQDTASRTHLTREMVSELHLSLFWKRGLELRPLLTYQPVDFSVHQIFPFNRDAKDVPEKLEWDYALEVFSAGVPLTDSLVMVIRTPDGHVAARVAARL